MNEQGADLREQIRHLELYRDELLVRWKASEAEVERLKRYEQQFLISCPWCGEYQHGRAVSYQIRHLIEHGDNFKQVQAQTLYALTEAERALRAWITSEGGMGDNIIREDRGRTSVALREIEKARAASISLT